MQLCFYILSDPGRGEQPKLPLFNDNRGAEILPTKTGATYHVGKCLAVNTQPIYTFPLDHFERLAGFGNMHREGVFQWS